MYYAIMNPELTAYSFPPTTKSNMAEIYEEKKDFHINPSLLYGHVLVKMKAVKTGISIKFKIVLVRWPIFRCSISWETDLKVEKIVKDHLGEINGKSRTNLCRHQVTPKNSYPKHLA